MRTAPYYTFKLNIILISGIRPLDMYTYVYFCFQIIFSINLILPAALWSWIRLNL
jgi:hypothetical protein